MKYVPSRLSGCSKRLLAPLGCGFFLLGAVTTGYATNWMEFGPGRTSNTNGVSFILCVDTGSIHSNGNIATFRQRAHGRDGTCESGTVVKTMKVDCAHLGAVQYLAKSPELRDMLGPVSAVNEYVCAHRGATATPRTAVEGSYCTRYIAALDRCIRLAPTDKIRKSFRDLRGAADDLVKQGEGLADLTCKADLPNMGNCLGLATPASKSAPSDEQQPAGLPADPGSQLQKQARTPDEANTRSPLSTSVEEQASYGILTTRSGLKALQNKNQGTICVAKQMLEDPEFQASLSDLPGKMRSMRDFTATLDAFDSRKCTGVVAALTFLHQMFDSDRSRPSAIVVPLARAR